MSMPPKRPDARRQREAVFGADPIGISGERRETLERINKLLASGSDAELKRAERVLGALLRG
jgi:hypothetical protein